MITGILMRHEPTTNTSSGVRNPTTIDSLLMQLVQYICQPPLLLLAIANKILYIYTAKA